MIGRRKDRRSAENGDGPETTEGLQGAWYLLRDLWRLLRGEDQRGRKVRWLLGLLRPYRARVAAMMVALLIATAAALAPPYLAGKAVDNGIVPQRLRRADADRDRLPGLGRWPCGPRPTRRPTSSAGSGKRALQDLRERIYTPPAGDVDRLLHAQPARRADLAA